MPVLPTPDHTISNLPGLPTTSTYVFLGAILTLCIGIIISRKSPAQTSVTILKPENEKEKDIPSDPESPSTPIENKPCIQQRPQPPPSTLPLLVSTNSDFEFSSFEITTRRTGHTPNAGTEASGVDEARRRHTNVFEGGVCKACEDDKILM
jgi:hypothetical protein